MVAWLEQNPISQSEVDAVRGDLARDARLGWALRVVAETQRPHTTAASV
jgi:hypothetical protein